MICTEFGMKLFLYLWILQFGALYRELYNVFGLILCYKTGINTITQEALSIPGIL